MATKSFDPSAVLQVLMKPYPELKDPQYAENAEPHTAIVQKELSESKPPDMMRAFKIAKKMTKQPPLDLGIDEIDWDEELAAFATLPYPDYYKQPVHSQIGGWLSPNAALNNRRAMETIYTDSHPGACTGLRGELAALVPGDSRTIVDLGAGDGDGAAALTRRFPQARVVAVEASPFMITVGRRQNRQAPSIEWRHCLAEDTGMDASCADCVTITLVLHECDDVGKAAIVKEALRLLRPGGTLVLSDTPPENLMTYRGFYEPWRDQWRDFDERRFLTSAGFTDLSSVDLTPGKEEQLFTCVATKPFAKL